MTFNIWDIKSRPLRVVVTWLIAALTAVVVLIALPFALVWLAGAGVWAALRTAWADYEWRELGQWFWAAATGKGEPV